MEGEVDLNQLIKKDREEAKRKKTHHINKNTKINRQNFKPKRHYNHQQQEPRDNHHHQKHQPESQSPHYKKQKSYRNNGYALFVTGFVSDVSTQDIYNLGRDRKITSIKTYMRGKDNEPIDPKNNSEMEVIITFADKNDADSFIKEYSNKLLDGKHSLTFQYRRAI